MPSYSEMVLENTLNTVHQLGGAVVGSGHLGKKADMPVRLVNKNTILYW